MIIDAAAGVFDAESGFGLLSGFYTLAVLIPGLAVSIRQLHDTNHSGWWLLIGLVPLIGAIVLLIFMFRDGQPGQNRFGPNPNEPATSTSSVVATAGHVMTHTQHQAPTAFCISCGTKLPEAAAYCPKCGAQRTACGIGFTSRLREVRKRWQMWITAL
jgi:ribosomal protein L40E